MPPKYLIEKVAKQITSICDARRKDSVFALSIKAISKNISKAEQERLSREILQTIDQNVRPAYQNSEHLYRKITYPMDDNTRVYGVCQTVTSSIAFM